MTSMLVSCSLNHRIGEQDGASSSKESQMTDILAKVPLPTDVVILCVCLIIAAFALFQVAVPFELRKKKATNKERATAVTIAVGSLAVVATAAAGLPQDAHQARVPPITAAFISPAPAVPGDPPQ